MYQICFQLLQVKQFCASGCIIPFLKVHFSHGMKRDLRSPLSNQAPSNSRLEGIPFQPLNITHETFKRTDRKQYTRNRDFEQ